MLAKVWSMGAVVLLAAGVSLHLVVRGLLQVPIEGGIALFMAGAALCLFATTAMGIFHGHRGALHAAVRPADGADRCCRCNCSRAA